VSAEGDPVGRQPPRSRRHLGSTERSGDGLRAAQPPMPGRLTKDRHYVYRLRSELFPDQEYRSIPPAPTTCGITCGSTISEKTSAPRGDSCPTLRLKHLRLHSHTNAFSKPVRDRYLPASGFGPTRHENANGRKLFTPCGAAILRLRRQIGGRICQLT